MTRSWTVAGLGVFMVAASLVSYRHAFAAECASAVAIDGAVQLNWTKVEGATAYDVFFSYDGKRFLRVAGSPIASTELVIRSLEDRHEYQFRAVAIGPKGEDLPQMSTLEALPGVWGTATVIWPATPGAPSIRTMKRESPVNGMAIDVREFDMGSTQVRSYGENPSSYPVEFARQVVFALRNAGARAYVLPAGQPATGEVLVEGSILAIDGGDRVGRTGCLGCLPFGIHFGGTRFAVSGRVTTKEGRTMGEFRDERDAGGRGEWFGGNTAELMHRCSRSVAIDVANMVTSGDYRRRGD